jgi:hypothetical protein
MGSQFFLNECLVAADATPSERMHVAVLDNDIPHPEWMANKSIRTSNGR